MCNQTQFYRTQLNTIKKILLNTIKHRNCENSNIIYKFLPNTIKHHLIKKNIKHSQTNFKNITENSNTILKNCTKFNKTQFKNVRNSFIKIILPNNKKQ